MDNLKTYSKIVNILGMVVTTMNMLPGVQQYTLKTIMHIIAIKNYLNLYCDTH